MLLKNNPANRSFLKYGNLIKQAKGIKGLILIGLCGMLLIVLFKYTSTNKNFNNSIVGYIQRKINIAKIRLIKNPIDIRKININIKYTDYQKLAYKRYVALKKGALITEPNDYVPATIEHNDRILKAKIRLKGDLVDQLKTNKWPLRIVMKGENSLFGMKVFSLHHPDARDFIYEWILHKAMQRENIIALRYDFIDVTINGNHLGIFALEEHFEKRLIENNRRREGPIVCFNEDIDIQYIAEFGWRPHNRIDFYSAKIDVYRPTKTLSDPKLKRQFMRAKNLLESFRMKKLKPREVFDPDMMGKFYALLDLFNAQHAAKYGNLKFYYNPITSKLEPICFDAEFVGQPYIKRKETFAEYWFVDRESQHFNPTHLLFNDNKVFEAYIRELSRITKPDYLNKLFEEIDNSLEKKMRIISLEFPDFKFNRELFYHRQVFFSNILNFPVSIHPYFIQYHQKDNRHLIDVKISNFRTIPVKILSLRLSGKEISVFEDNAPELSPSIPSQPVIAKTIQFELPLNFRWKNEYSEKLEIDYSLLGLQKRVAAQVIPWADLDDDFLQNERVNQDFKIQSLAFVLIDEMKKKIYFKPGNWTIETSIVFPPGYTIVCKSGTHFDLLNSGSIVSYSPFHFIGTSKKPIYVYSRDSTSQGIILINTKEKSLFNHVIFSNLSNIKQEGLDITGAVTFFQAPVEFEHCQFLNNRSEDALNIIDSDFSIKHCRFHNNLSDAIDVDFGKGMIKNSIFTDTGNDAIDISGSELEIHNIKINGAGDKGLSVGEKSKMKAIDIEIMNTTIGAASKDLSELIITKATLKNNKTGLAVFKKKSEFGPGRIVASKLTMQENQAPYFVEKNSKLILDNVEIGSNSVNNN